MAPGGAAAYDRRAFAGPGGGGAPMRDVGMRGLGAGGFDERSAEQLQPANLDPITKEPIDNDYLFEAEVFIIFGEPPEEGEGGEEGFRGGVAAAPGRTMGLAAGR